MLHFYIFAQMTMEESTIDGGTFGTAGVSKWTAVIACISMALFYVAILYSPTLILRLPPPDSFKSFMIRRFICAAISTVASLIACSLILPIELDASDLLSAYGIRADHFWQAAVFPLSLTALMYAGSLLEALLLLVSCQENQGDGTSILSTIPQRFVNSVFSMATNISAWRNYFVAPVTEELVFRACMIPLLLCGGFNTYTVVFLCPVFFSLAHLNHLLEYAQRRGNLLQAFMVAAFQLGYTVIFGSYASFLYIRTGHLVAPLVAHIFCNYMGLPAIVSRRSGLITFAFLAGLLGYLWLLFPLTSPQLYNNGTDDCNCWHRYCSWN
ncbi:PREDICTED: CAAX prenyl protease 2 isoform X1 [Ipomoea nil]|uniref:CAAX prenyl protease 2 isoform X1 n=2 Tax=Ipomoea nil TaxID=35883 RepID=UPI0009014086|nr:PREDICTED: CAAX prenyl protease 2 isoform X1 [Ipomoea nil]